MAQIIKLRRSAVAGNVPTTSQLGLGELAINTADGKIYFEKNDGSATIQTIVTTNSETTGSITITGNISGSATSTGSFGHVFTSGTSHFSGHVGIQTAPGSSNELTVGGGGFVKAEYFRGQKFYFHSNNAGMAVASNHIYFDDNDLTRIFHIKRDGGVQISGSHDSTGSFGKLYICLLYTSDAADE